MINLAPIKPWIIKLDDSKFNTSRNKISVADFDRWFEDEINVFINCSRVMECGQRVIQTNDIRYSHEITVIVKMIDEFIEDESKDYYYQQLLERHNSNIEFESINGLNYNPKGEKKKSEQKPARKRNKQLKLDGVDTPKKETAAERKLREQAVKISKLSFGFKLVKE